MTTLAATLKMIIASWLTCALFLPGTSGLVLCLGDDGHAALEIAHHAHCGSDDARRLGEHVDATTPYFAASQNAHTGCVDLSLPFHEFQNFPPIKKQALCTARMLSQTAACTAWAPVLAVFVNESASVQPLPDSGTRIAFQLLVQRTVLLRT